MGKQPYIVGVGAANLDLNGASALRMQTSTARPLRPSICVIPTPATSACRPEA